MEAPSLDGRDRLGVEGELMAAYRKALHANLTRSSIMVTLRRYSGIFLSGRQPMALSGGKLRQRGTVPLEFAKTLGSCRRAGQETPNFAQKLVR